MDTRYLLFHNYIPEMFKGGSSKPSGNLIFAPIIDFLELGTSNLYHRPGFGQEF